MEEEGGDRELVQGVSYGFGIGGGSMGCKVSGKQDS